VATVNVTETPTTLDVTGAAELAVTNTGAASVYVNTQRLRPGQRNTFDTSRPLQVATQPGETSTVDTAVTKASGGTTSGGGGGAYPPTLAAGVSLAHQYDPQRATYNLTPTSANRFRGAMVRALTGGASARILVIGNSNTYGTGATVKTKRWATTVQNMIAARLGAGVCGTGYIPIYDYGGPTPKDLRFTGTTPTHDGGLGAAGPGIMGTNGYLTTNGSTVFTPGRTDIDRFIISHYKNQYSTANGLNVLVDGALVGTINCNQASGSSVAQATFDVATGTAHTLTLTATAGNGGLLLGVEGRVNGGLGGCTISAVGNPGSPIAFASDTANGGSASLNAIAQQTPDLVIICHQTNDYMGTVTSGTQTTIANYTTRHQAVIDASRTAGADVMLATEFPNTDATKPIPMTAYTAALYGLADTNNLPLVDVKARLGDWATQVALGATATNDHGNDRGHYDTALGIYGALSVLGVGL
jgi:hypothetical protein